MGVDRGRVKKKRTNAQIQRERERYRYEERLGEKKSENERI